MNVSSVDVMKAVRQQQGTFGGQQADILMAMLAAELRRIAETLDRIDETLVRVGVRESAVQGDAK